MERQKRCHCCLQRPSARDLKTPFTQLGITESYSIMMEECFAIQLLLDNDCEHGICLECVDQLRGACNFKLQVLQCQAELRERWEQHVKEEETPVLVAAATSDDNEVLFGEEPDMQPECVGDDPESDAGPAQVFREEPDMQPECVDDDPESDAGPAQVFQMPPVPPNKDELCEQPSLTEINTEEANPEVLNTERDADVLKEENTEDVNRLEKQSEVVTSDEEDINLVYSDDEPIESENSTVTPPVSPNKDDLCEQPSLIEEPDMQPECVGDDPESDAGAAQVYQVAEPASCVSARAREQLAARCSVRLERLRVQEAGQGTLSLLTHLSGCDKSDHKYKPKLHQNIHIGAKHFECKAGKKPFHCDLCDYKCSRKSNLQRHLMIHTGKKPFQCDHCDYRFSLKTNLQRHLRIHTGEKPFQCNHCDYKCSQKTCLQRHLMIHTGKKPFQCDHCDYKCRRKTHLQRHLRIHTGGNE